MSVVVLSSRGDLKILYRAIKTIPNKSKVKQSL